MSDLGNGFTFVFHHKSLLWHLTQTHLLLSFEAILISIAIAVPLGLWLGHIHRGSFIAINVSTLGRALPSLGILALLLPWLGIGRTVVIIALVVLAFPPILTNTYVAMDEVDPDAVEAAKGMGMRPLEVILRVELPLARSLIFAGIRLSTVFVIATATLAGDFGGGGLGNIIFNEASYTLAGVIGASYVIIVLAFLAQLLFLGIERLLTPSALRRERRRQTVLGRQAQIPAFAGQTA